MHIGNPLNNYYPIAVRLDFLLGIPTASLQTETARKAARIKPDDDLQAEFRLIRIIIPNLLLVKKCISID